MKTILIERLTKTHVRSEFDCGQPALNRYIQELALQNDARNVGRTFVAVEEGTQEVLGYYTLASGRIAFAEVPDSKKLPPNMPVPVILLGRLAVDLRCQGTGLRLGETLLLHALWRSSQINKQVAVFAVEVDAIDDKAKAFYERYGFVSLLDEPRHMYLAMKTIESLGLDF